MKILVTGAGGYLGGELCMRLAQDGNEVIALYRSKPNLKLDSISEIQQVQCDIMDSEKLEPIIEGCDQIYHLAAFVNSFDKDVSKFYEVNVGGTINVLKFAEKYEVKSIVATSTIGVIGPADPGQMVSENSYRKVGFYGDYDSSKAVMQEKIQDYVRKGMDIKIVCPVRVFGPGKLASQGNLLTRFIRNYLKGPLRFKLGNGKFTGCYGFIDDIGEGYILAMNKGVRGEKYILGSFNATFDELIDSIKKESGLNKMMIPVPIGLLLVVAQILSPLAKLFSFNLLITKDQIVKFSSHWHVDLSRAKNELGLQTTSIDEAMRKTISWIRDQSQD